MTYLPDSLETPCALINMNIVENNIQRAQDYLEQHGIKARPHIKTHKLPGLAHMQIAAGAIGITCQKIGEAEIMAAAGIEDILITYNILGESKLNRLRQLGQQIDLTVVADSKTTVSGLSASFANSQLPLKVLVECDTGLARCGVQSPESALSLAKIIDSSPGLKFVGLMTYPAKNDHDQVESFLQRSIQLCRGAGLDVTVVSNGGTPGMLQAHRVSSATEHRSGTYIYNDRSLVASGDCDWSDCALQVVATVVSRPTADRAIIDAGSKALSSDTMGLDGFGFVTEYPDALVRELHEEHGIIDFSGVKGGRPAVGAVLHIIPNHACVVSNLYDCVFVQSEDGTINAVTVEARGQVW